MRPDRAPSPFSNRAGAGKTAAAPDGPSFTQPAAATPHPAGMIAPARAEPAFARTLDANPIAVRGILRAAVTRFARSIGPDEAGVLELTLAEVLNNVVEHGYNGQPAGLIRVVIGRGPSFLNCRVEDAGSPVPDDILLMTDTDDDPFPEGESLPEGGFGWKLIHALVTDLRYSQIDGYNRMTFRIPLNPKGAAVPQSCPIASPSKPESNSTTAG